LAVASFDRTTLKTGRARQLRRAMTPAETRLWSRLRNDQIGVAFRRQHPVGPYVLDFFAPSARLAIELDGGQHGLEAAVEHDRIRALFLASRGIEVVRFWNRDVFQNIVSVLDTIWQRLDAQGCIPDSGVPKSTPTLALPLSGGGERKRP
jgi:very-short-patch-repair endonuclease